MTKLLTYAIVLLNLITFLLYGWDKMCARKHKRRIPERILLGLAFFGGATGAMLGMTVFRHKTKHKKFIILIPLFLILHIGLALWIFSRANCQ